MSLDRPALTQLASSNTARQTATRRWAAAVEPDPARQVSNGHIVSTPLQPLRYKVVLRYRSGDITEHPFETMRAGEMFIRRQVPGPQVNSGLREFEGTPCL